MAPQDGTLLDFESTIEEEIEAQTGQKPERWHVSQKPNNEDPTKATLVISFPKPLNSNFRLLGQGSYSFKLTKPKKLSQFTHCWKFHPPTRCIATKVLCALWRQRRRAQRGQLRQYAKVR
jgi:hypothetical protein